MNIIIINLIYLFVLSLWLAHCMGGKYSDSFLTVILQLILYKLSMIVHTWILMSYNTLYAWPGIKLGIITVWIVCCRMSVAYRLACSINTCGNATSLLIHLYLPLLLAIDAAVLSLYVLTYLRMNKIENYTCIQIIAFIYLVRNWLSLSWQTIRRSVGRICVCIVYVYICTDYTVWSL